MPDLLVVGLVALVAVLVGFGIALGDSEQNHETTRDFTQDLPADPNLCPADALKNCAHKCVL